MAKAKSGARMGNQNASKGRNITYSFRSSDDFISATEAAAAAENRTVTEFIHWVVKSYIKSHHPEVAGRHPNLYPEKQ